MSRPKFESPFCTTLLLAAIALLLAAPLAGEESANSDPPRTVIKAVRHINVEDLVSTLELLDITFAIKSDLNSVVLRGPDGGDLQTALKLIDALDTPSPTISLRVFILTGSRQASEQTELPGELEAVTRQLRDLFGFKSIRLLDTAFLQVLEGHRGFVEGGVRFGSAADQQGHYELVFSKARVSPREDGPVFIRLAGLKFNLNGKNGQGVRLQTDVEVPMGQKAVIGKSTPGGSSDSLVLVVEASAPSGP